MKRMLVITCLAVLLVVPIASAGDWTQPRADAQSTGFTEDPGPAWPDVGLRVELPGEGAWGGFPIVDGVAYVPYRDQDDSQGAGGVVGVDLDTGETRTIIEQAGFDSLAADGEHLYGAGAGTLAAYPLSGGEPRWTWAWPSPDLEAEHTYCRDLTVLDNRVLVGCTRDEWTAPEGGAEDPERGLVAMLQKATGEVVWTWEGGAGTYLDDLLPRSGVDDPPPEAQPRSGVSTELAGVAVLGQRVLVAYEAWKGVSHCPEEEACVGGSHYREVVDGLEAETGEFAWRSSVPPEESAWLWTEYDENAVGGRALSAGPTGGDEVAFLLTGQGLQAVSPATGVGVWDGPRQVGGQDTDPFYRSDPGMAYDGEMLFVASAQTVHRFDSSSGDLSWRTTLPPETGERLEEDLLVTGERLYAGGWNREADAGGVYAIDKEDGHILWRFPIGDPQEMAISGETLAFVNVAASRPGEGTPPGNDELIVLGRTQASPTPHVDASTSYPDPGETVLVDLSESQAGLEGPVTRYKAIWGDGSETDWQTAPVLAHAYNGTGDTAARFIVGNDANQTASTTMTFHVGQAEPNWISGRFAPENQDMTFGVLGIALALGGGAIGIARRRRKRSNLQAEVDALEAGFAELETKPGECEAFLDNRKATARSLAIDGHLEEDQVTILESRAEELRRELRTGAVEDEFGFLPYALVVKARTMLEDGRVTELEAEAFLAALEEADFLRGEQKALVRQRIEDWYGRDVGGGRA